MSNRVRCKMYVVSKSESEPGHEFCTRVRLSAVCDDANKSWSKWTPSGSIDLSITNPAACDAFEAGREYFVDFSPAGE